MVGASDMCIGGLELLWLMVINVFSGGDLLSCEMKVWCVVGIGRYLFRVKAVVEIFLVLWVVMCLDRWSVIWCTRCFYFLLFSL